MQIDQTLYRHISGIYFVPFEVEHYDLSDMKVYGLILDGKETRYGFEYFSVFRKRYEICGTDRYVPKNVLEQYESEFLELEYYRKKP